MDEEQLTSEKFIKTVNTLKGLTMVCFIRLAEKMGLKLPIEEKFLKWFEEKLKEKFDVLSHEELEKVLNDRYWKDSWSLKLIFEELLVAYKLKLERKKKVKVLVEEGIV